MWWLCRKVQTKSYPWLDYRVQKLLVRVLVRVVWARRPNRVARVSERAALQTRHPPLVGSAPAYRVMMTLLTHVCGLAGTASQSSTTPDKAQAQAQVRKVGRVDCCRDCTFDGYRERGGPVCTGAFAVVLEQALPPVPLHALVISSHPRELGLVEVALLAGAC